jgi:hypothetical protein
MRQTITVGPLTATIRECWVDAEHLRLSAERPNWTMRPTIHAIVVETVKVEDASQRQGHFTRFLDMVCADERFDMVVVEGVGNKMLAAWLMRQGWEYDSGVMDFYRRRTR